MRALQGFRLASIPTLLRLNMTVVSMPQSMCYVNATRRDAEAEALRLSLRDAGVTLVLLRFRYACPHASMPWNPSCRMKGTS